MSIKRDYFIIVGSNSIYASSIGSELVSGFSAIPDSLLFLLTIESDAIALTVSLSSFSRSESTNETGIFDRWFETDGQNWATGNEASLRTNSNAVILKHKMMKIVGTSYLVLESTPPAPARRTDWEL